MTREANRAQWAQWVRAQGASGKSMTAFCREHGINARTFFRWARILGGKSVLLPAEHKAVPRFARVELVRQAAETAAVSVRLPCGVRIQAGQYPDPAWVRAVISGLVEEGFR